jgi:hypothetical protein
LLAAGTLGLFLAQQQGELPQVPRAHKDLSGILQQIDTEIDTILAQCLIEERWIRKQQVLTPNNDLIRTERRITIPPDLLIPELNQMLNAMMKRYGGRAIAVENPKEKTVTIHLKQHSQIFQTIVLKTSSTINRRSRGKNA